MAIAGDGDPVRALVQGHWYDALAALLAGPDRNRARSLATAARRVLDLDAEDFGSIASGFDTPWAARLADSSFPLTPREPVRGALGSLVPLYELMLEVVQIRATRREPLQVVVTAHLIGEYLVQLAWESVLGHGGDPARMPESVGGTRWGTEDPACAHNSALRSTARRALNACRGDVAGYTTYLDKFHSRLGEALAVCALNPGTVSPGSRPDVGDFCPNPCRFVTRLPEEVRLDLDARVRLALVYVDSPIVALRHHAPVGHFFGVPSVAEISAAWVRTWERVSTPWRDGSNPLLAGGTLPVVQDEALPGLAALVSAVAGRPIGAGTIVADIRADLTRELVAGAGRAGARAVP